jgi:hypothetical protein
MLSVLHNESRAHAGGLVVPELSREARHSPPAQPQYGDLSTANMPVLVRGEPEDHAASLCLHCLSTSFRAVTPGSADGNMDHMLSVT